MYRKLQGDSAASEPPKRIDIIRNKASKLLTIEVKARPRWKEHFEEMLNRPSPERVARSIEVIDEITLDSVTRAETRSAIPSMSAAKIFCEDDINVEIFNQSTHYTIVLVGYGSKTGQQRRYRKLWKLSGHLFMSVVANWWQGVDQNYIRLR